jgi:hypothetical protein
MLMSDICGRLYCPAWGEGFSLSRHGQILLIYWVDEEFGYSFQAWANSFNLLGG